MRPLIVESAIGRKTGIHLADRALQSSPNEAGRWTGSHHKLVDHSPDDHGRVGASETERIRQRDVDFAFARYFWHEIDGGLHRRIVKIDGRRRDVVTNRKNRENRLDRARG